MDARPDTGYATLPRGQHDLPPEYVAEHQRERILDATTHVLAERGYGAMTLGHIVARARVSRRTFYAHFESKEQCALAAFDAATQRIADTARDAYLAEEEWDASMAAATTELVRLLVDHPHVTRTCFLEMRSVGPAASKPLSAARLMCTDGLRRAVADRPGAGQVEDMAVEMGMGGLIAVVRARFAAGDPEALRRELPEIARALLGPLAGVERRRGRGGQARAGRPPGGSPRHLDSGAVDRGIFLRSLGVQTLLVGVLFAALALALPKSFFEDYGWATGPVAWIGCSLLTARLVALPAGLVLFAALAGGVAGFLVRLAASHAAGLVVSLLVFAASCGGYEPETDAETTSTA